MYTVVRKDHALTLGQAVTGAGAAVVRCADRYRRSPEWADAFREWERRSYRKVALRAGVDEFERLRAELEGAVVETPAGMTLLCLPPRRRQDRGPLLRALRPFTDAPRPAVEPPAPTAPALVYVLRPGVLRSMGKAMAQAGHAALMCVDRVRGHDGELQRWRADGMPGDVRLADDVAWSRIQAEVEGVVVVRDGGLTQVAPGTETVLALAPSAPLPKLVAALPRVP